MSVAGSAEQQSKKWTRLLLRLPIIVLACHGAFRKLISLRERTGLLWEARDAEWSVGEERQAHQHSFERTQWRQRSTVDDGENSDTRVIDVVNGASELSVRLGQVSIVHFATCQ